MYFLSGAAFCVSIFMAANASATGFNHALELAYNSNPQLYSGRESLKSVDENASSAFSGFLPSVTGDYSRGKSYRNVAGSSNDSITENSSVELSQPLFKGGATYYGIKKADSQIMSARASLVALEQEVLLSAISSYMDVIRDQEVLDLNKKNIEVLKKHLDFTKEKFSLGEVTKTDVAQAEASLAEAVAKKIRASGDLDSSKAKYKRVVGEEPIELEVVENPVTINSSLDELIEMALKSNPDILALEHSKDAAKNDISIKKSRLLPEVNVSAGRSQQKGALFASGDIRSDTVAINVSIPLYQSGSEYSDIRKAKYEMSRIDYDVIDTQNRVRENVIRAYNDFKVSNAVIKSNRSEIEASKVALEGTEAEAKAGSRTTLDVLDAEQDLFEANVNLVRSKRDEIVSSYNLLAQVGRLNAKELGLDVKLYDPENHYREAKHKIIGF